MPSYELDRPRCSKLFLIYVSLTILWVSVNAMFYENRFKSLSQHEPWASDIETQDFASSEYSPSYVHFPESGKRETFESSESYDRPNKEWFSASSSKRVPLEDKHFKKIISPFYTITEKDSQKYKDIVMKSGIPYCQEIKTKKPSKDGNKNSMVCYKCKNPKSGATYEQCSYVSKPSADSSNQEEVVDDPSEFRSRRSNSDEGSYSFRGSDDYKGHDNPYRFNEKFFSDASEGVPAEYKNKDEKCEKVFKDSMVCMVCKNTKSNAKYEQCSYVRQPNEKRYAFTKSSSFKNPKEKEEAEDRDEESESKPVRERTSFDHKKESEKLSDGYKKTPDNCREVEKDSKTCTICKDPETGGNYEKCSYTYQPDDKVYKYSSSKSFGYPRKSSSSSSSDGDSSYKDDKPSEKQTRKTDDSGYKDDKYSEKLTKEADEEYKRDYSIPESSYFKDDKPEYIYHPAASETSKSTSEDEDPLAGYERSKSESEKIAERIEPSYCKRVQKGSLSCKVCKDPKTGSNSEQCSYEQQPSDKNYSYSKSKSFKTPTETEDKSYDGSEKKESHSPYKDQSFGFFGDEKPSERDARDYSTSDAESKIEEKKESTSRSTPKKAEVDFSDAFKRKAEIQKFLQEFQKEDRSNCKKLMRNKMTCYQCVDDKGFRKEECAFITDGDIAEDKIDETEVEPNRKVPRSIPEDVPVEPEVSASENIEVNRRKPEAASSEKAEKPKEAEAYEYVAETKPVFDKVLGFTLPAYMLATSEHEEEFDKIVVSDVV
ncbi:DNA ligase 1 [Osmia bicornis bicornis]|uniref:DNA ligase 1 n=1 Tax=Osmia bicornis bicornis TaxID=1437191 RepID=UPI001EAF44AD|nr:DNA ligase 1 [Osmia bicornis bicornis]